MSARDTEPKGPGSHHRKADTMSENTNETTEAVETESTEQETQETQEQETEQSMPETGHPVVDGLIALSAAEAHKANELASKVSNAKGTYAKNVKEVRDTNETDEKIVAFREWETAVYAELNKRREAIDAHIAKEYLGGEAISEAETEEAEKNWKAASAKAKAAWKQAKSTAELFGIELPDDAPMLKTLAGRATTVAPSAASGTKRFRFDYVTMNGAKFDSLSQAALNISQSTKVKTSAKDLQEALVDTVKTDDVQKMNGEKFAYAVTKDGKVTNFEFVVYAAPKDSK